MRMPYFDSSMVDCHSGPSPLGTYCSYMCRSKGSYVNQERERSVGSRMNAHVWGVSQERYIDNKPRHISKFRNVLSETISNITKGNKLEKGESVEITLEIELMKTENCTTKNSLVEVTIVQHNKTKEPNGNSLNMNKMISAKIPLHLETHSSTSESASQKRRNWFQRVITRQSHEENSKKEIESSKAGYDHEYYKKTKKDPVSNVKEHLKDNESKNISIENPRSNFVTVLPEELTISGNYTKGYRKVLPSKGTPVTNTKEYTQHNSVTVTRKNSLVKKLSDMFLPNKKANKKEAVKTALTALKKEVDNNRKKERVPVNNLGKLVGNLLVDLMDTSDKGSTGSVNDLPGRYLSFFEPVSKTNDINTDTVLKKHKIEPSTKGLHESHSETCCVIPRLGISVQTLKTSRSTDDCRVTKKKEPQSKPLHMGDSVQISPKKNNKNKCKNYSQKQKKLAKGDSKDHDNRKVNMKSKKNHNRNKLMLPKNSEIQWNGQTIKVNKEMKERIEMLIINELQNVALKEGMECNVTAVPSTESSIKNLNNDNKTSMFLCELDISDDKFKKHSKNKKRFDKKVNPCQSPKIAKKTSKHSTKITKGTKENVKKTSGMKKSKRKETKKNTFNDKLNDILLSTETANLNHSTNLKTNKMTPNEKETEENDIQITYMNRNIKNWSAESNTVTLERSGTKHSQLINQENTQSSNFQNCSANNCNEFNSGFIKRIESNDSTWKNYLPQGEVTEKEMSCQIISKQFVTGTSSGTEIKLNSVKSVEHESTIEIELDIQDLELILTEAKQKQNASKVLITAHCRNDMKKPIKPESFTAKNSFSYTNQLLLNASKKLEKYVKKEKKTKRKLNV